jgi:hypothetical protein
MHSDLLRQLRRLATEASAIVESLTRPPSWSAAFTLLHHQHRVVACSLDAIAAAPDTQLHRRLTELRNTLRGHARAEEELFCALERRGCAAFLVAQSRDEHLALGQMIEELHHGLPPCWREHLAQMKLLIEDHIDREEHELFPRAVHLLGPADGRRVLAAVRRAQG